MPRAVSANPGVSQLIFTWSLDYTPEQIIGSVKRGLYLTELIGFGVNGVTGDYSRGAGGL